MRTFPETLVQHFRCSKCYRVLSIGPIYSGPDGAPVCGECPHTARDVPNMSLEIFCQKFDFPCRYSDNGCNHIVQFNDVEHARHCIYQGVSVKSPLEIIDKTLFRDWLCHDCQNYLTVGPLFLTPDGEDVCGRCANRWSEVHEGQILIENWKLEFVMEKLPLPCIHRGCKRSLKWGEVATHEIFCSGREYNCPVTPYDSCLCILPAEELYAHFKEQHPAFILNSTEFQQNLDQDVDTHRLLKFKEHFCLLMIKVRLHENRMWFSAALIGNDNAPQNVTYDLRVSNVEGSLAFLNKSILMQSDLILRINEYDAACVSLDSFRDPSSQKQLQEVICSLNITKFGEAAPNLATRASCKWENCIYEGPDDAIKLHERDACLERQVKCSWNSCDLNVAARNKGEHEKYCEKRLVSCRINNCKGKYPNCDLQQHELQCEFRRVFCDWENCNEKIPFNKKKMHESKCNFRVAKCKWCSEEFPFNKKQKHDNGCNLRMVPCKWKNCNREFPLKEIQNHETHCDLRTVSCTWENCDQKFPYNELQNHVSRCDYRLVLCKWVCRMDSANCGKQFCANEIKDHQYLCGNRSVTCPYKSCKMDCLLRNWNVHIKDCKHRSKQIYKCKISKCCKKFVVPPLTQHVLSEHPRDICEGPNVKRSTRKGACDVVYMQYDGLLFMGRCKFHSDGRLTFLLHLLGPIDLPSKYKYALKVIHPENSGQAIKKEIDKWFEWNEISMDDLGTFVKDNFVIFEWAIINK